MKIPPCAVNTKYDIIWVFSALSGKAASNTTTQQNKEKNTMSTTASKQANTTAAAPVQYWGVAPVSRDKEGIVKKYAAVRFTKGATGYKNEADIFGGRVNECVNISYAIVRAVECAKNCAQPIDDKTREKYPAALVVVLTDERNKAEKALKAAQDKATAAANRLEKANTAAAAALAAIPVLDK